MEEDYMYEEIVKEYENYKDGLWRANKKRDKRSTKLAILEPEPWGRKRRCTEEILNSDFWVDADYNIHDIKKMDKDYVKNIMLFLYRKRDYFWINCNIGKNVTKFKNPDEFYEKVITKSTLWKELTTAIEETESSDFNFEV